MADERLWGMGYPEKALLRALRRIGLGVPACAACGLVLLAVLVGCKEGGDAPTSLQDQILRTFALDRLTDEPYLFPANPDREAPSVCLELRKWDPIFVGDFRADGNTSSQEFLSALIPGRFDHMLAYVGKDAEGYAYAVEVNVDDLVVANMELVALGDIRLLCLGTDRASLTHPSGERVHSRDVYGIRWAKSFTPAIRGSLMAADTGMVRQVASDLRAHFPFQLQIRVSLSSVLMGDYRVELVDDGFAGGSGCADYWTTLYERAAGVCIQGVRMSAGDLMAYFTETDEGGNIVLPPEFNLFGDGSITVRELIDQGFYLVDDAPHPYPCDGSFETGIVIPDRILRCPLLADPVSH